MGKVKKVPKGRIAPKDISKYLPSQIIYRIIDDITWLHNENIKFDMNDWIKQNGNCSVCLGGAAVLGLSGFKIKNGRLSRLQITAIQGRLFSVGSGFRISPTNALSSAMDNLRKGNVWFTAVYLGGIWSHYAETIEGLKVWSELSTLPLIGPLSFVQMKQEIIQKRLKPLAKALEKAGI